MEKLTFKEISEASEVDNFLGKVENYNGVRLPEEYANRSKIVGAYKSGKLVAGYMLVTKPGFRSLLFVPDAEKAINPFFQNDQFEMMEVNGLWIGPALKTPTQQMRVWMELIKDIFVCRKNYVLLMRDARNKNMERFMGMAHPSEIYEGEPWTIAGENTHNRIQVSYTTRWKIVLNSHKYVAELFSRQRRASAYNKHRNLARHLDQPSGAELA